MPKSAYFQKKIDELLGRYNKAFPDSEYKGRLGTYVTHITPGEERLKKMYFIFPKVYEKTYGGIPAIVMTVHQHAGSKTALRMRITNMISGVTRDASIHVSMSNLNTNHKTMDTILRHLREELWLLGPMDPDHYAE